MGGQHPIPGILAGRRMGSPPSRTARGMSSGFNPTRNAASSDPWINRSTTLVLNGIVEIATQGSGEGHHGDGPISFDVQHEREVHGFARHVDGPLGSYDNRHGPLRIPSRHCGDKDDRSRYDDH